MAVQDQSQGAKTVHTDLTAVRATMFHSANGEEQLRSVMVNVTMTRSKSPVIQQQQVNTASQVTRYFAANLHEATKHRASANGTEQVPSAQHFWRGGTMDAQKIRKNSRTVNTVPGVRARVSLPQDIRVCAAANPLHIQDATGITMATSFSCLFRSSVVEDVPTESILLLLTHSFV